MTDQIKRQTEEALGELIRVARLGAGQLVVVGCSSSEIVGRRIGHGSDVDAARIVYEVMAPILAEKKIYLAAQCCEHLNRALIVEREYAVAHDLEIVAVRPQPKAGGAFATVAYESLREPVAVEHIKTDAGLDIGGTLIGMHLRHVAVPVRLATERIGNAVLLCARTRPKYIGGPRAVYPDHND